MLLGNKAPNARGSRRDGFAFIGPTPPTFRYTATPRRQRHPRRRAVPAEGRRRSKLGRFHSHIRKSAADQQRSGHGRVRQLERTPLSGRSSPMARYGHPPKLGSTGLLMVSSNSPSSIRRCIISCSMKPVSANTTPSPVLGRYLSAFSPTGSRRACSIGMTRPSRPDFCSTVCMACSSMRCALMQRSVSTTHQPPGNSPADPSGEAPRSWVDCQEISKKTTKMGRFLKRSARYPVRWPCYGSTN